MLAATFGTDFDPLTSARAAGYAPTSGFRTQAHQDALRRQGLTKTRHSQHTAGNAYDFRPPQGVSQAEAIAWAKKQWPGARVIPTNGGNIHVTYPEWGGARDVSGSRRRYGG